MEGYRDAGQRAFAFRPQVISVDLQAKHHLRIAIDIQCTAERGERLSQHHRYASMQITKLLAMLWTNGHRRHHTIPLSLHKRNTQHLPDRPIARVIDPLNNSLFRILHSGLLHGLSYEICLCASSTISSRGGARYLKAK